MKKFLLIISTLIAISLALVAVNEVKFNKEVKTMTIEELLEKGTASYNKNQFKKAVKYYDKALEINNEYERLYVFKSLALDAMGKKEESFKMAKDAVKVLPDDNMLNFILGIKYLEHHKYTKSEEYLLKSIKYEANSKNYTMLGVNYAEQGKAKEAIQAFSEAIKLDPKFVDPYVKCAKICGDIGNYKCSLENYRTLTKMYPENHFFWHMSSLYKTNTKDLEGAMKDIDKAISLIKKPNSSYLAQKAWVYLEQKDYEKAKEYLLKSLEIDPNDGYALGLYMFMANDNEAYDRVIEVAKKMLKVDPTAKYNHALYSTYARALYKTGNKKQALRQIEKAIKLNPLDKDYPAIKEKMLKEVKID